MKPLNRLNFPRARGITILFILLHPGDVILLEIAWNVIYKDNMEHYDPQSNATCNHTATCIVHNCNEYYPPGQQCWKRNFTLTLQTRATRETMIWKKECRHFSKTYLTSSLMTNAYFLFTRGVTFIWCFMEEEVNIASNFMRRHKEWLCKRWDKIISYH